MEDRWYSRGYLPHCDNQNVTQFISFRLADSLPQKLLNSIERELNVFPKDERLAQRFRFVEKYVDMGYGSCALANAKVAEILENSLLMFDGERYDLVAWCIMPNHIHVLIRPNIALGKIVQSWKSYVARWTLARNEELDLDFPIEVTGGKFWEREYWDRFIRNEEHFYKVLKYIHRNPVKARLCKEVGDWRWSSAWEGRESLRK